MKHYLYSLITVTLLVCTSCVNRVSQAKQELLLNIDVEFLSFQQQAVVFTDLKKVVEENSPLELKLLLGDKMNDKDVIYLDIVKDEKTGLVDIELENEFSDMYFEGIENDFDKIRKLTSDCMKVYIQNIDQKKLIESTSKAELKEAK